MTIEPKTVASILTAATDSVTIINEVNAGTWNVEGMEQSEINDMVQRNVDHLEIVLAYAPVDEDDDTPDVAGSSEDKTSYTDAISTGKSYIENNS
tara:strand:+ start:201 stop:485 length:285 start_codon:yes stop_codon:yes gene_type:complete